MGSFLAQFEICHRLLGGKMNWWMSVLLLLIVGACLVVSHGWIHGYLDVTIFNFAAVLVLFAGTYLFVAGPSIIWMVVVALAVVVSIAIYYQVYHRYPRKMD